ncbi:hypothetical protein KC367_g1244 [Hortaea werneckii]|uniref:Sulfhydryl oxidase n=2 Tax=Hortaea werneckii TaxID=91943 RepID=A0A3M7IDU7_HORWE|nr:hypothetical protein KC358_g11823 [Hortaea werneckii]OTA39620.1 hypothetical protein BTJ68_00374 [Hortaea werneckii EXF-2000]KAI6814546.1 hypothetical protein KC350_g11279 [Hortaea werneckii]KAI6915500.1 hypothetical protein KC348_g12005 [Hortaea werneckii]KAI6928452.1 hypothetical protein KC341_g11514 [Hortaea werneckii]
MGVTDFEFPILQHFFCVLEKRTGIPAQPLTPMAEEQLRAKQQRLEEQDGQKAPLPKGVVLGPDGKPCRSCTSFASMRAMARSPSSPQQQQQQQQQPPTSTPVAPSTTSLPDQPPPDCPPDVDQLGRSTWTFLHTLTATYPVQPSPAHQQETRQFISLFSKLYPCWVCADDFRAWMREDGNAPRVSNRDEFGRWMCEAHNAVNVKLGKERFDCGRWQERWRTGWRDGRCDP